MTIHSERSTFGSKDALSRDIERRIREGELLAGQKLSSERELGVEYRLSRPIVREALRGLSERGLIEISPGRGSFVRAPQAVDLSRPLVRIAESTGVTARNLVEARSMLETAAAAAAATNALDSQIVDLESALISHQEARALPEIVSTDIDFHTQIALMSGNPVLSLMFGAITTFVQALMYRSHTDREAHDAGDPLHAEIYAAIRDRDAESAAEAMRAHIELALDLYGDDLDRPLTEVLRRRGIDPDNMA